MFNDAALIGKTGKQGNETTFFQISRFVITFVTIGSLCHIKKQILVIFTY
jgi:hypothetical protein